MSIGFIEVDQSEFSRSREFVMAMAGPAEKGPIGSSRLLRSERDLILAYGNELATDDTIAQVRQALQGGASVRYSRSVHYTDVADPATKTSAASDVTVQDSGSAAAGAVQTAVAQTAAVIDGDQLTIDVNGAPTAVTFSGVAAVITNGIDDTWDLSGGLTLTVKIDQGPVQDVSVVDGDFGTPAVVDAAELASVLGDGRLAGASVVVDGTGNRVTIQSDTKGSVSYVQVTGGTMNAVLTFSTTEVSSAGPNTVPNLNAVTTNDLFTLIDAAAIGGLTVAYAAGTDTLTLTTVATGAVVYLGFDGDAGVPEKFGWTTGPGGDTNGSDSGVPANTLTVAAREDGTWADGTTVTVTVNAVDSAKVDIVVSTSNPFVPDETYTGVTATTYPTTSTHWLLTSLSATVPAAGTYTMTGGNDGTASLTPATRLGTVAASSGIYGWDTVDFIDFAVPNLTDSTQQVIAKNFAESQRLLYHADIPSLEPADAEAFVSATGAYSSRTRLTSSYVAYRFGRPQWLDESVGDGSTKAYYGGNGALASVLSYNDNIRDKNGNEPGQWLAPSGGARGIVAKGRRKRPFLLDYDMSSDAYSSQVTGFTNLGVNFFVIKKGEVQAKGNRTCLSGVETSKLIYLSVRRLLLSVYQAITPILEELQDEPIDTRLFRTAHRRLSKVIDDLFASKGAFQRSGADSGFVVNCDQNAKTLEDAVLNTPATADAGIFKVQLRVKPVTAVEEIEVTAIVDPASVTYVEDAT